MIGRGSGIVRANRVAMDLLGYRDATALNKNIDDLSEELAIRDPVTHERLSSNEMAYRLALGGKVRGAVTIQMDITALKQHEADLAEEAFFRETFIGILGHDLRDPLSGIMMTISTLLAYGDAPAGHAKLLQRCMRSAKCMLHMVEALLDLTRTRLGDGLELHREPVDLEALCRNTIDELEASHPSRRVRLRSEVTHEWRVTQDGSLRSSPTSSSTAPTQPGRRAGGDDARGT